MGMPSSAEMVYRNPEIPSMRKAPVTRQPSSRNGGDIEGGEYRLPTPVIGGRIQGPEIDLGGMKGSDKSEYQKGIDALREYQGRIFQDVASALSKKYSEARSEYDKDIGRRIGKGQTREQAEAGSRWEQAQKGTPYGNFLLRQAMVGLDPNSAERRQYSSMLQNTARQNIF